ncbi:MAG: hypothetical protein HQL63_14840, partial [Magnetococcales bacterium]|nr:hypothetical protein [Magnetococcales bacterium]
MSEQLVTLIVTPGTAWSLAVFVLLLGFLEWGNLIYFRLRSVRQQLDQALDLLASAPEDAEEFAGAFRTLSAKWGAIPFYRLTWSAFRGTVVTPTEGGGVRALVRATTLFDPEVLLPMALPIRRMRAVPLFLLGTGILLSSMVLLTTLLLYLRGATPGDSAAVQAAVQNVWRHLPLQLVPAAMGVFVAVWIALENRRHMAGLEARIARFAQELESRVGYMAGATLLMDHLRSEGDHAGDRVRFTLPPNWVASLAEGLNGALAARESDQQGRTERVLSEGLAELAQGREKDRALLRTLTEHTERIVRYLEGKWQREVQESLEPVLQRLGRNDERWETLFKSLEKGGQRQTEDLARLAQRLAEIQEATARDLDQSVSAVVDAVGSRMGSTLREQMGRLVEELGAGRSSRDQALRESFQEQMGRLVEELGAGRSSRDQALRESFQEQMGRLVEELGAGRSSRD